MHIGCIWMSRTLEFFFFMGVLPAILNKSYSTSSFAFVLGRNREITVDLKALKGMCMHIIIPGISKPTAILVLPVQGPPSPSSLSCRRPRRKPRWRRT
jgi:hypothetical protein